MCPATRFVIYSGLGKLNGACAKGVLVAMPENPKALVVIIGNLISGAAPDAKPC